MLFSCKKNEGFFKEKKFYKVFDKNNKYLMEATFLSDSIFVVGDSSLTSCKMSFTKFRKHSKGLYYVEKDKLDSIWIKVINDELILSVGNDKSVFKEVEYSESKVEIFFNEMQIAKKLSDKKIIFTCDFNLSEIPYFYDNSIDKIKSNLKNPNSANFDGVYIKKYEIFKNHDFVKTDTIVVSVDVEAKNGFGNFTESTYYIYFLPEKKDSKQYQIHFSNSPIYNKTLETDYY